MVQELVSMVASEKTTLKQLRYHVKHTPSYSFIQHPNSYTKFPAAKKIIGQDNLRKLSLWYRGLRDLVGVKR